MALSGLNARGEEEERAKGQGRGGRRSLPKRGDFSIFKDATFAILYQMFVASKEGMADQIKKVLLHQQNSFFCVNFCKT